MCMCVHLFVQQRMTCTYVYTADTGDQFPRAIRDWLANSPTGNNNMRGNNHASKCDALCCKCSNNNSKMDHEIVGNMARAT